MLYEGSRWITTTTNVGTGWHHIVMTINSSGVPTGYLDGTSVGSFAGTGPIAPTSTTYIGSGGTTARFFNGRIDDVRLYNRALTLTEVLALYSAGAK